MRAVAGKLLTSNSKKIKRRLKMKLSKFTFSDGNEVFEGYTDGTLWNGWANVCFSREQLNELLRSLPYDFKFSSNGGIPQVTIWWEKGEAETTQSTALPLDNGYIIEGYFMDGLEFMEIEE
jgi:hypothetical protein